MSCPFHASGPCLFADVEAGVRSAWRIDSNFSSPSPSPGQRYAGLMDNSLMLWVRSLGPILDAFQRDGVPFYPMKWNATDVVGAGGARKEMFSVLASPGGKVLIELASEDSGGRGRDQFHTMDLARAVLSPGVSNEPFREGGGSAGSAREGDAYHGSDDDDDDDDDYANRPVAPLRISRAVSPGLMEATLAFYREPALGFGHARVLLDESDAATGARAVTLQLSPNATVHLQLWAREESGRGSGEDGSVGDPAPFPSDGDFAAAVGSNQVNGGQPASASAFCGGEGQWSVASYNEFLLKTHASVMTTTANSSSGSSSELHPPAGNSMDVFVDDHISWDCTSPLDCDEAAAGEALYGMGLHVQWLGSDDSGYTAYSHDPSGYGIELHWFYAPEGFKPSGTVHPNCFAAFASNGTCDGAVVGN